MVYALKWSDGIAMVIPPFEFRANPLLIFGPGKIRELPRLLARHGRRAGVVRGRESLKASGVWDALAAAFAEAGIETVRAEVVGEPTPEVVDNIAEHFRQGGVTCVAAIGGGSVLDAGKAAGAMVVQEGSVEEYLEGVGDRPFDGRKLPFIAVPTTAGTGSEAAKNAVLSRVGENGYKRSLRHDRLMPDVALIDPRLHTSCPPDTTAACGLDALTQLLESYVSTKATPLTDALAESGLAAVGKSLLPAWRNGEDVEARTSMAYAAYLSGVALTNAGLGVVHGFASSVGGKFSIPHGVLCGTLLEACTRRTIERLREQGDVRALAKYARAGRHLTGKEGQDIGADVEGLLAALSEWTRGLKLPRLAAYGLGPRHVVQLAAETGCKDNPVPLSPRDLEDILRERL
jgi:alcohol dehydrogenase class IV